MLPGETEIMLKHICSAEKKKKQKYKNLSREQLFATFLSIY